MSKITFDHWEEGNYGDTKTHYFSHKLPAKGERSRVLYGMVTKDLIDMGSLNGPTTRPSILEWGCNVGRNLFPFYCAGWSVSGIDINLESIQQSADLMSDYWKNFRQLDLFNKVEELSLVPDNQFDVTFCMGFLMHLPDSKNKKRLVSEMIRVSKTCYIYEPWSGEDYETSDPNQKGWHLSMLNYEKYDVGVKMLTPRHLVPDNCNMKVWRATK